MLRAGAQTVMASIRRRTLRLWQDRRGIAAIEFALIVPILLVMYFVTMEASQAIETNKKVSRIGNMVADLVTQQQSVLAADLDAIMKIGTSTLQPYNRSTPQIIITAIQVTTDATPKVQVVWSRKVVNGVSSVDATKNTNTTVPDSLKIAGTFLIRVESDLAYQPIITWSSDAKQRTGLVSAFDKIPMSETYYLRPRRSQTIPCSDC